MSKTNKPKAANPKKTKPTKDQKARHLDDKIVELEGTQRVFGASCLEWEEAHAHAAELKKTMDKNQARLNQIAQDIVDIRTGNYTPPLPFEDDPKPAGKAASAPSTNGHPQPDEAASLPILVLARHGLTEKKCEALADQGFGTVGDLEKAMRENEWWHRDLRGFGEEWLTRLQDAHLALRKEHPYPDDSPAGGTLFDDQQQVLATPPNECADAWQAGFDAASRGEKKSFCPHQAGTPESKAWRAGHQAQIASR